MEIRTRYPYQKIDDQKYDLTREEKVIYDRQSRYGKGKNAFSAIIDIFLHGYEHQRKKSRDVLKMIEEDVIYLESGIRVEKSAYERGVLAAHESSYVSVRRERRQTVLYREEHRH